MGTCKTAHTHTQPVNSLQGKAQETNIYSERDTQKHMAIEYTRAQSWSHANTMTEADILYVQYRLDTI